MCRFSLLFAFVESGFQNIRGACLGANAANEENRYQELC